MKAVVLVGGEGTRLRPLTYTTPKQLLPVAEVPMLERVLAQLAGHGIDEAVLSMGYRPDAFTKAYPEAKVGGVRLSYAVEPEPLDTAGAVRFAADHADVQDTFVVVNGDVLTDLDLSSLIDFHREKGASATIHLTPVEDPSRFGVVVTDREGRVIEFVEKPAPGTAPTNLVNAGTYVLEPDVLCSIAGGRRVSIERETFPALAEKGVLYARASDSYWLDAGTPEAYLRANADLLDGRRGTPPAPSARELSPAVWVIGSPSVEGVVGPRVLLGEAAVVAAGAAVRNSVIGARCNVEASAVVEGSVILPGTSVGEGALVNGSIVGRCARLGPGCELEPLTVIGDREVIEPGTRLVGAHVPAEAAS